MVQVPYEPNPQVQPKDDPTPYVHLDTPLSAFGGAVAQATSHLGEVESHVGDELFARASAMQELNQQAEASAASADYVNKLGELHGDYTSKLGKNAVDGYQPFVEATNQSRMDIRNSLSSPLAQRYYDQETRNMQSRAIWSASGHLGQQNKSYLNSNADAHMDSNANYLLSAPTDDASFQATLKSNAADIETKAQINGWSDDKKKFELDKANSSAAYSQIIGLTKTAPFTAQKLLDQRSKDGTLQGADAVRAQALVQNHLLNTGARQESSKILAGNSLAFGDDKVEIDRAKDAIGGIESSNRYDLKHPPPPGVKILADGKPDYALGRFGVMRSNLSSWLSEAGMPQMNEDEYIANHSAQDQLFAFKYGQYQDQGGSANAAAKKWFTGTFNPKEDANDGNTSVGQYVSKFNANLARGSTGSQLTQVARSRAQELAPYNAEFADAMASHVETLHSNDLRIQREDEFNHRQTIEDALGPDKDGKLPTSIDDLKLDPKFELAWDALKPSDQRKYEKVIQSNIKNEYEWTPESQKQFQNLIGIAKDPTRTPEETDKFLNTDIVSMNIPWQGKNQLLSLRKQIFADRTADPQMSRAIQVLKGVMDDAGIKKSASGDNTDYLNFVGSLHDVYQSFLDDNKRRPKDDEIMTMGSRLIGKISEPGWLWGTTETPMYQVSVPKEAQAAITNAYRAAHGVDPPDSVIHSVYIARQYQQLYGKKKPISSGPQVPLPQ